MDMAQRINAHSTVSRTEYLANSSMKERREEWREEWCEERVEEDNMEDMIQDVGAEENSLSDGYEV